MPISDNQGNHQSIIKIYKILYHNYIIIIYIFTNDLRVYNTITLRLRYYRSVRHDRLGGLSWFSFCFSFLYKPFSLACSHSTEEDYNRVGCSRSQISELEFASLFGVFLCFSSSRILSGDRQGAFEVACVYEYYRKLPPISTRIK